MKPAILLLTGSQKMSALQARIHELCKVVGVGGGGIKTSVRRVLTVFLQCG